MFPNPQDALPLPPHADLEQYKKLAKDLVKACRSAEPDAIGDWVVKWLETLARLQGVDITTKVRARIDRQASSIEEFVRSKLSAAKCALADAQFVIARSHGFLSWPRFAKHLEGLSRKSSPVSSFEDAADAIITGDTQTLQRLLHENPALIRARSTREHRATLLHYISANGVENFRQRTPRNAVEIAEILLQAGAEVDATAVVYRGACTTLELVATSVHPLQAGVQNAVVGKLLDYGAAPDGAPGGPGMIIHCLGNGCPQAAELLANRGAKLTLEGAAALGRLDVVKSFFNDDGSLNANATRDEMLSAFVWASGHSRRDVVEFLLRNGADISAQSIQGMTGLHWAVISGDLEMIKLLLERKAPLEVINSYGGTVLGQALWSAAHSRPEKDYTPILETLIDAGATVPERHPPINKKIDALLEQHGSVADDSLWWYGEKPRKRRDVSSR